MQNRFALSPQKVILWFTIYLPKQKKPSWYLHHAVKVKKRTVTPPRLHKRKHNFC